MAAKATAVMAEEENVGGGFGRLGRAGLRFRGPLDALVFSSAGCFSSRACAWLKRGEETRRAECGLYAAIRQLWRPKNGERLQRSEGGSAWRKSRGFWPWQALLMRDGCEHGRSDQPLKLAKMLPGVPAHGGLGDEGGDCTA